MLRKGGSVILVGIWPNMKPDEMQGIRRIIYVFDFFKTIKRMFVVIQCNLNVVVNLLLPVVLLGNSECNQAAYKNEQNEFLQVVMV